LIYICVGYTNHLLKLQEFISKENDISSKVDFIIENMHNHDVISFSKICETISIILVLLAVVIGFVVSSFAELYPKSFVVLTRESKKNMDNIKENEKRRFLIFFFSLTLSIISGVIGNIIFNNYFI